MSTREVRVARPHAQDSSHAHSCCRHGFIQNICDKDDLFGAAPSAPASARCPHSSTTPSYGRRKCQSKSSAEVANHRHSSTGKVTAEHLESLRSILTPKRLFAASLAGIEGHPQRQSLVRHRPGSLVSR